MTKAKLPQGGGQSGVLRVRYPFAHRPWQRKIEPQIVNDDWILINAHRGSGKSWFLCHRLIQACILAPYRKGKVERYAYIGMSIQHAKQTAWDVIFKTLLADYANAGLCSFNGNDLTINFYEPSTKQLKSQIVLNGYDTPEKNRGMHLHGLGLDEAQGCPEEVWQLILAPTTVQHKAWVVMIGTPNGPRGLFYKTAMQGLDPKNKVWKTITQTVADTGEISEDAFEKIKAGATKAQIDQEYYCSFDAAVSNRVYYNFFVNSTSDEEIEVIDPVTQLATKKFVPAQTRPVKDLGQDLYVGMDFNVGNMSAAIGQKNRNRLELLGEIHMVDATTDQLCERLKREFPNRRIIVCPDASGSQRNSATEDTNHSIIRKHGFIIRAPKKNPSVESRVQSVNMLLENALGERRLFIDPKCEKCIESLRFQQKDGSDRPDKKGGYDHMADAIGYLVMQTFPYQRAVFSSKVLRL